MRAGLIRLGGRRASIRRRPVLSTLVVSVVAVVVVACGGSGPMPSGAPTAAVTMTRTPWSSPSAGPSSIASPSPTLLATPSAAPTAILPHTASFYAAVVAPIDDTRESLTEAQASAAIAGGKMLIPCEFKSVGMAGTALTMPASLACVPLAQVTQKVHDTPKSLGLLPPGLVTASVKVLRIGDADLFGSPTRRAKTYPLMAVSEVATGWESYAASDIRTLISTGDTCADRGVSYMAVTNKKGWDWVLAGGYARYRGLKQSSWDWPVPIISRAGYTGAMAALISDNDVSVNDFECPVVKNWTQHNTGMVFSVDPRFVTLMATKGGLKAVTLGSNHITDAGLEGVRETVDYLDKAGIKHTGAGRTLAEALAPAVVDANGLKFAFVGWDDISGSRAATSDRPGVAPMTNDNVCNSIKAAKAQADVVIAMPQWGWPEYHANATPDQRTQRAFFYDCGADGILGSGTHWASWVGIWPTGTDTHFAIGSHGNFFFDQSWSRQTMEGVVVEATFSGKRLVQFRLHPYVVVNGAQPCLLDPTKDGAYVLDQVWKVSDVKLES